MGLLTGQDIGVRLQSPITNMALAGVGNRVVIYQISNWTVALGGQMLGTKSVIITRVTLRNNAAGNQVVSIGTGLGAAPLAALLPGLDSMNNLTDVYAEDDLPEVETFLDITAFPLALAALGTIDIQIELVEIG